MLRAKGDGWRLALNLSESQLVSIIHIESNPLPEHGEPMRYPDPNEEYVIVVNNKGRKSIQRVEYIVTDVRGETIYVTTDGLTYASRAFS